MAAESPTSDVLARRLRTERRDQTPRQGLRSRQFRSPEIPQPVDTPLENPNRGEEEAVDGADSENGERGQARALRETRRAQAREAGTESTSSERGRPQTSGVRTGAGQSPASVGSQPDSVKKPGQGARGAESSLPVRPEAGSATKASDQAGASGLRGALAKARQGMATERANGRERALQAESQEAIELVALETYRNLWRMAHEALEDFALPLFWVPLLSVFPVLLTTIRIIFGNLLGSFFQLSFMGVQVPLVPRAEMSELVVRLAKGFFFLVLTFIWIAIITLLYQLLTMSKAELAKDVFLQKLHDLFFPSS